MIQVISDRELADLQRIRDFLVCESLCHQFEYLTLTVAQSCRHLITGKSLCDPTGKRLLSAMDRSNGPDNLLGWRLLVQITLRSCFHCSVDLLVTLEA